MKHIKRLRLGALLMAFLMVITLCFSACDAEEVELALDIADVLLESTLSETESVEQGKQELTTPESSQSPPVTEAPAVTESTTPPSTEPVPSETPAETPSIEAEAPSDENAEATLDENGRYTTPEDVALYIHTYGKLPCNFITKNEAKKLGWVSNQGNLWDVTDQMSIGGDRFGNYEGLLPDAPGRKWTECDVNYEGGFRGSERILFSNDGLIYYTDDHYESFTQLY